MRLSTFVLAATCALLASPLHPQVPPGTDSVAGPIEVFVNALTDTVTPGGAGEAEIAVVNSSTAVEVRVLVRSFIIFADGSKQLLKLGGPQLIPPNSAVVLFPFFVVPEDAELGTASIQAVVVVARAGTGSPPIAADSDNFLVAAP